MKLIIIYYYFSHQSLTIYVMLSKTEYICIYMYMFISILPTHLCRKKYVNFTIEMERFTVHDYRKNESKQCIPWWGGRIGVLHLGLHCILNSHFNHSSKVHALLLCTERDLSPGYIPLANVLHYGTLYLNGEFYFYINIYWLINIALYK